MKKKTKIFIVLVCIVVFVIIMFRGVKFHQNKTQSNYLQTHYIFDKNFRTDKTRMDFSNSKYDFHGLITAETLSYFRFLNRKIEIKSIDDLGDHYNKVRQYLHSQFKEVDARRLFEIYQKYLACQIKLSTDSKYQAKTPDIKQLLNLLYTIQNFRREKMGKEMADALFAGEVKEKEYFLRREMIVADPILYGKEKESRLRKLKSDMWDGSVIPIGENDNPYNRYQFKIQLYQKDLDELGEKERGLKIEEFRKEFFSKEQIKKLHEVDNQIAGENENLKRYRAAEQKLLNATDMSQAQRDQRIKALQDEFFGSEADAFRRTEAIQKGLEKK